MEPKQWKNCIFKIILDFQNPKSTSSHTNILPNTVKYEIRPEVMNYWKHKQQVNIPCIFNPSKIRERILILIIMRIISIHWIDINQSNKLTNENEYPNEKEYDRNEH